MTRRILPAEEINEMVRAEMRKHERCVNVQLTSVYWHEPDSNGCNWDANIWKGDQDEALGCKAAILDTVRTLRTQFNLPEPA